MEIKVNLVVKSEYDRANSRYVATVTGSGSDRKKVSGVKRGLGDSHKSAVLELLSIGGLVSPATQVVRAAFDPAAKKE